MEQCGNRHEKSDSCKQRQEAPDFLPSLSRLLNMRIFNHPPRRHKTTHIQETHVWTHTVHISDCDKYTALPQPPLSLAHVHAHTYFPLEEWNFHIFLGDPGNVTEREHLIWPPAVFWWKDLLFNTIVTPPTWICQAKTNPSCVALKTTEQSLKIPLLQFPQNVPPH